MSVPASTAHYLAAFERVGPTLPGAGAPAVAEARRVALARFVRLGMPTARAEAWRYSAQAGCLRQPLDPAPVPMSATAADALHEALGRELDSHARIVFVDGRHLPREGEPPLPPGVHLLPLSCWLESAAEAARPWLAQAILAANDGPAALNLAFASEGALLELRREAGPVTIEILFVSTGAGAGHTAHTHLCVEVAEGAEATVIERHLSLGECAAAAGADVSRQFRVGTRARLLHAVLQHSHERLCHIQRLHARVEAHAGLELWSLALGAAHARYEALVELTGHGAGAELAGVYALTGRQSADHHLVVKHLAPATRSDMRFRGLLDGQSRGAFTGAVMVPPGADGTSARQSNDNLLLSPHAEAASRPELAIETDDVQCSHGSTVGQLDEAAVFYLRSRGLDETTARSLLSSAFAVQVLRTIPHAGLRNLTLTLLAGRLPQRLALEEML
jgi:Fe-S cluster assembly protein SufD